MAWGSGSHLWAIRLADRLARKYDMAMKLLPFGSVTVCPKCAQSVSGHRVRFAIDPVIPGGNGDFIFIGSAFEVGMPHLRKNCPHCHFGWLEEPADSDYKPEERSA
jgi:hypothetical protein